MPLFAMILWSFMFSFTRVYRDFSINAVIYFGHPWVRPLAIVYFRIVLYIIFFYQVLKPKIQYMFNDFYETLTGTTPKENEVKRHSMVDIDSVVHMCTREPSRFRKNPYSDTLAQAREEAAVLISDMYLRMKYCFFTGIATAYFSIYLPTAFVPVSLQPSFAPFRSFSKRPYPARLNIC